MIVVKYYSIKLLTTAYNHNEGFGRRQLSLYFVIYYEKLGNNLCQHAYE